MDNKVEWKLVKLLGYKDCDQLHKAQLQAT